MTNSTTIRGALVPVRTRLVSLMLLFSLLLWAGTQEEAAAALNEAQKTERALQFITQHGTALAKIMASESMAKKEKRLKMKIILEENFDLATMMRAIVGPYWRKMSEPQRARYRQASTKWIVLYSSNFLSTVKPSKFDVISASPLGKDVLVQTETLTPRSNDPFVMHWRVRFRSDDQPSLIDMHFRGLSMVAAQRSEVSALLVEKGIAAFLETLDKRLEKITKEFNAS